MAISWLWPKHECMINWSVHKDGCLHVNTISQLELYCIQIREGPARVILHDIVIYNSHSLRVGYIISTHNRYSCIVFTEYIAWKWIDLPLRGKKRWRFIAPLCRSEGWWHHSTTPVVQNSTCPWLPYLTCTWTCICSIRHWQNTNMELTSTVELISADNTIFSSWEKAQHWTPYLCPVKSHIFCLVLMSHTYM